MIILNALSAIFYLFAGDLISRNLPQGLPKPILILLAVLGIANVIFAVLLFKWKKLGFWGFVVTSIGALIINLSMGLGVIQSLFGLLGIAILYAVLQIKKEEVSAWVNLE